MLLGALASLTYVDSSWICQHRRLGRELTKGESGIFCVPALNVSQLLRARTKAVQGSTAEPLPGILVCPQSQAVVGFGYDANPAAFFIFFWRV